MLFSSPVYLFFILCFFPLYIHSGPRLHLYVVIIGSLVFYSYWNVASLWVPVLLTGTAYLAVVTAERYVPERWRKVHFVLSIAALLVPLLLFKYSRFIGENVFFLSGLADLIPRESKLPLGISFITFSMLAYVIDVHRGVYPQGTDIKTLLGFTCFFPHLIAGPILRPGELMPQIATHKTFRDCRIREGVLIFAVGLVKKLVVADAVGRLVDPLYVQSAGEFTAWQCLAGIYAFSVQIYCDFSGYTDMAIGSAYLLGVELPKNFERPYLATSVADFWQRWHITLSHWLRDYLYIPLGGNRRGYALQLRNVAVTMLLGGLWHGANWTFVLWGGFHALGIAAGHAARRFGLSFGGSGAVKALQAFLTFHFVTVGWVLFRAPTTADALRMLSGPFKGSGGDLALFASVNAYPLLLMLLFFLSHPFDRGETLKRFALSASPIRYAGVVAALLAVCLLFSAGSSGQFIYFEF